MSAEPGELKPPLAGRPARSLRVRVGLVVGGAMALLFVIFTIIITSVTGRFFAGLQDNFSLTKIDRVTLILDQAGAAKGRIVRDNAEWDETFEFINGKDPEYLARNYAPEVNSTGQDVMLVFDRNRKLVGSVQTQEKEGTYSPPPGLDIEGLAATKLLGEDTVSGLMVAGDQVLLLSACPVRRSDLEGESNGWLVQGTYFSDERVRELMETAGAELVIYPVTNLTPAIGMQHVSLERPFSGGAEAYFTPARIWQSGEEVSGALLILPTLSINPKVVVAIKLNLHVYQHAMKARNWILIVSAVFGLIFVALALSAMEWSVLRPLAALDREMAEMSRDDGKVGKLKTGRDDEIGRLAHSANRLLERVLAGQRNAQEQKELLAGVLDSTNEAVIALQSVRGADGAIADLRVVLINHSGEKMLRVDEGELNEKLVKGTYPKLAESGIFDHWLGVAVSREPTSFESYYEGHKVRGWYRNSVAPWGDGIVVTVTDINDRKLHEQELAHSMAELERFNSAMIGREERILEMKREVNVLRTQAGLPPSYDVDVAKS